MPESIQDWLKKIGFSEDQASQTFRRYPIEFSFAELIGQTVGTFKNKAVAKGWVIHEDTKK
jgi:hypothetical protein